MNLRSLSCPDEETYKMVWWATQRHSCCLTNRLTLLTFDLQLQSALIGMSGHSFLDLGLVVCIKAVVQFSPDLDKRAELLHRYLNHPLWYFKEHCCILCSVESE